MAASHASLWRFRGDTADLLARYDALMAEMGADALLLHICLPTGDGALVVDLCPTEEAWRRFREDPALPAAMARHGLPEPEVEDHPVHLLAGTLLSAVPA